MSKQSFELTQKQYDDLLERRRYLEEEAIPTNGKEIEKAKDFGDLSENAEYHEAKGLQDKLIFELTQVKAKINRSSVIKHSAPTNEAQIGNNIKVLSKNDNEILTFMLIGEDGNGVDEIDIESKLGKSIYKKKVGDEVSIEANDHSLGELYFKILEIY
mgnify:CR=1 FL=1